MGVYLLEPNMLKLTQAQMHTLVCTNHKKERKDPIGSWETPQAIKRAALLKEIEIKRELLALEEQLNDYNCISS